MQLFGSLWNLISLSIATYFGHEQNTNRTYADIHINASLLCEGEPAADVLVELDRLKTERWPRISFAMNKHVSDQNGVINLHARFHENITAKVFIYHDCHNNCVLKNLCKPTIELRLPDLQLVGEGIQEVKEYQLGPIELSDRKSYDQYCECIVPWLSSYSF
ncbi:hypothetical protein AB6A40_001998 [Gnathostoma spinigerum]|uniref:Uncharacterized protein n=1 Tax=Gnathostoma spinigerum TaxID=75299 RepID=A0ABD6ED81_9BILA